MPEESHLERWRVDALIQSGALNPGPAPPHWDSIARFAASMARTPVGLVSFVDDKMCWIKASFGADVASAARAASLCAHAIRRTTTLWIEDAAKDEQVRSLPCVTAEPRVRFYAGAPILTPDGFALGAVGVFAYEPRPYDETASTCLMELARLAGEEVARSAGKARRA